MAEPVEMQFVVWTPVGPWFIYGLGGQIRRAENTTLGGGSLREHLLIGPL